MTDLQERLKSMTPLQRAVFALQETQARLERLERQRAEPIAIVGIGCRFPGGIVDAESFWRVLCSGVSTVSEVPADRWNVDDVYDPDPKSPGKTYSRWGAFLDEIAGFDHQFFGISETDAQRIDPQHRLLLELAWEALEDAGIPPSRLRGSSTGVYVGISGSEYTTFIGSDLTKITAQTAISTAQSLSANRISFALGLQGPSFAIDTACSSALTALHLACQSLRDGECSTALVGAVNLILLPGSMICQAKSGAAAVDGQTRAFDANATGYVRGEGAGMVLLRPLVDAVRDHNPIHAVIHGSAIGHNGQGNGITAPSRTAQERLIQLACQRARIAPGQLNYVETQGTATRMGDLIEATALGHVLSEGRKPGSRCVLGAVKSLLGHSEAASGLASLIKAALVLQHRQLPPSIGFQTANPEIPFDQLPIEVPQTTVQWSDNDRPLLAGVSAFGFGGGNAHVILGEAPDSAPLPSMDDVTPSTNVLTISARNIAALRDLAKRYQKFLSTAQATWDNVCHSSGSRRDHHDFRLAIVADSTREATALLHHFEAGIPSLSIRQGQRPPSGRLRSAMVFLNHCDGWPAVRVASLMRCPGFAAATSELDQTTQRMGLGRLIDVLTGTAPANTHAPIAVLIRHLVEWTWWRHIGLHPDVVVGEGCGELAAAVAAGILTTELAIRLSQTLLADGNEHATFTDDRRTVMPCLSASTGDLANSNSFARERLFEHERGKTDWERIRTRLDDYHINIGLMIGSDRLIDPHLLKVNDLDSSIPFIATIDSRSSDRNPQSQAIALLYSLGADFIWQNLSPDNHQPVRLPGYPWQRQQHWLDVRPQSLPSERSPVTPVKGQKSPEGNDRRIRPELSVPYCPPSTQLEVELAGLWAEALQYEQIGVADNFFELGGDSILALKLLGDIQRRFDHTLPSHVLFQLQCVRDLAVHLEQHTLDNKRQSQSNADELDNEIPLAQPMTVIPRVARPYESHQRLNVGDVSQLGDDEVERLLNQLSAHQGDGS